MYKRQSQRRSAPGVLLVPQVIESPNATIAELGPAVCTLMPPSSTYRLRSVPPGGDGSAAWLPGSTRLRWNACGLTVPVRVRRGRWKLITRSSPPAIVRSGIGSLTRLAPAGSSTPALPPKVTGRMLSGHIAQLSRSPARRPAQTSPRLTGRVP